MDRWEYIFENPICRFGGHSCRGIFCLKKTFNAVDVRGIPGRGLLFSPNSVHLCCCVFLVCGPNIIYFKRLPTSWAHLLHPSGGYVFINECRILYICFGIQMYMYIHICVYIYICTCHMHVQRYIVNVFAGRTGGLCTRRRMQHGISIIDHLVNSRIYLQ